MTSEPLLLPQFFSSSKSPARCAPNLKSSPMIKCFNFSESIYGQRLTVEFKNKLRDEKKFDNIDLLKEQILQDISQAKEILE